MKKGFTLIEVLSIIVILGIISVLVLPKINTGINDKKQKEYDKLVETIENAGKSYLSSHPNETLVEVDTLLSNQYLTSNITNPFTNSNITGCISKKMIDGINKYEFENTCVGSVNLTVNLNGGTISSNPEGVHNLYSNIVLDNPSRDNNIFDHWEIVEGKGSSTISGNLLTIGTRATTIKAIWQSKFMLTIDLNGGIMLSNPEGMHNSYSAITLDSPSRDNSIFDHWEITEGKGNSIISGNLLTMGTSDTTIKAIFTTYTENGLITWYDGINNTGSGHSDSFTEWKDLSGNDMNGTLTNFNMTSTSGWSGNSLIFDGSNDKVALGNNLQELFKNSNTIEILIKFSEINVRDVIVGNCCISNNINYELTAVNKHRVYFNNGSVDTSLTTGIVKNTVLLISYVFDKTNSVIYIFQNGVEAGSITSSKFLSYNSDYNSVYIGADSRTGATCFKGEVYSFRVYNRAISQQEILENYEFDNLRY